jgi:hypothetical protein
LDARALLVRLLDLAEAGRMISAANLAALKAACDALLALIARAEGGQDAPSDAEVQRATEAARAALAEADLSFDGVVEALRAALAAEYGGRLVCVRDCYDDYVVYQVCDDPATPGAPAIPAALYKRAYLVDAAGAVTFGDPVEVRRVTTYEPVAEARDPNVGGGVDRSAIPAEDFAGKNRSFPIVTPQDVADAAASIGRAGNDNYAPDELKRRIIAIAKRKGEAFVARLPAAWRDALGEAAVLDVSGDIIPLVERAVRRDGTVPIRIIAPGWGSSGYYSPDVLERDAGAFAAGTQMFWDHPLPSEEADRPERSLRDLAGKLVTDARWDPAGPAGPGLYAEAQVFGPYREAVEELAPHIGVSIRALGRAREGEAEGRRGKIIEAITAGRSVDFVTVPGAGGRVCQLFESARARASKPPAEGDVTETEAQALREANRALLGRVDQLAARLLEADAREFVRERLAAVHLPEAARQRLAAALVPRAPARDGVLDREAFAAAIAEAAAAEARYLADAGLGAIRGMGLPAGEVTAEEAAGRLERALRDLGLSESAAKIAAVGRA